MKKTLAILFCLLVTATTSWGINYYSASTGAPNNLSTWWTNTDGATGTQPSDFTTGTFNIANGNTTGLTGDWTVGAAIEVYGGQILNLNGHTITADNIDAYSGGSYLIGSATSGIVIIGTNRGNGAVAMDQTSTASATLGRLSIYGANGFIQSLNLRSNINIASTGYVSAADHNSVNANGYKLTLKSDASGTARIAPITNSGSIIGNITIERYIPGQRGYRLLGQPYTTNIDLSQLSASFDITGITGGSTCVGTNPSVFSYTPGTSPSYTGITTGTGAFPSAYNTAGTFSNGILAFIRGAKGEDCNMRTIAPPSNVTAATTGTVNKGSITEVVPANGWNIIANPYPSQVLLTGVSNIGSIDAIVAVNPAGQFINTHTNGTQYFTTSSSAILPINGAVLMHNNTGSAVTLTFHETDKVSTAPNVSVFKTTSIYPTLELSIYNGSSMWDNWRMILAPNTSNLAGDNGDLEKLSNAQFDIYSLSADNQHMNQDARDADSIADGAILPLGIRSEVAATYILNVSGYSLPANKTVYLHDKYTNTYTLLNNGTSYTFTVYANAASQGENRLELLFNNISTGVNNVVSTQSNIQVTPNPAANNITLSYPAIFAGDKEISIMNAIGQAVRTVMSSDRIVNMNISGLANGMYLIKTSANGNTATGRFIKN